MPPCALVAARPELTGDALMPERRDGKGAQLEPVARVFQGCTESAVVIRGCRSSGEAVMTAVEQDAEGCLADQRGTAQHEPHHLLGAGREGGDRRADGKVVGLQELVAIS
jgi:hypothetical protein